MVQRTKAPQRMPEMVTAPRELTNFATLCAFADPFGTDLAHSNHMKHEAVSSIALNVATETHEMNRVALLTSTYGRDLESCTLLCESVDRHVSSFSKHYLLVADCDLPLFSHFESERREVIPASTLLPYWLRPLPRVIQRKRQTWWSFRTRPVSGWQVQQYLKIAAVLSLPYERTCILDSDVVFFRDFDLSQFQAPNPIPLFSRPDEAISNQPRHSRSLETGHALLGLPAPPLPVSDFIGPIIFRDRQTTHAMVSQVEAVTNLHWIEALCRTRDFSETMLYGTFVQNDARFFSAHRHGSRTQCASASDQPKLSKGELNALLRNADKDDVAFSAASFPDTPVQTIRAAIEENEAIQAPRPVAKEPARLDALC
jgi:hypothetical protein